MAVYLGIKVFITLFRFQSSVEVFSIKGNMCQSLKADHVNITIVNVFKICFCLYEIVNSILIPTRFPCELGLSMNFLFQNN